MGVLLVCYVLWLFNSVVVIYYVWIVWLCLLLVGCLF